MHYYISVVHQEENSAYGLSFPDLPGCFAASDTWEGIPQAAVEALDLWFEDQPDIEPSSLEALRARQDVLDELKEGAVLMPIPYIPADTATVRANISIERGLLRAIDEAAKARGMTRSGLISSATRREIVGVA
ncbi:CopG family transcriptional regulator [Thioclava dalianensis]|uniref:CopG family transcriptional regulator n=1 Tax=Thioclava dalianensis TaxID=1185766 RepID=A0A074TCK1_9RHOB|nr:type II toxin-antitoxin system HicB family antitoxin [Thioclava dalianensis]KEP67865.1 CopG family transcriptional regulator [Thioclava dalianensis]SFN93982.1 Predicted nuclease of the RNAse H fold, HicB family [Thioclava dalianensis]